MKHALAVCLIVFTGVTSIGCTSIIKYDLTDLNPAPPNVTRQEMKVAVAPFQDQRAEWEKNPTQEFDSRAVSDSMFVDADVPRNLSEAIVTHMNYVHLFKAAEMTDRSASVPSPAVLNKLKGAGYAMLLTGNIKRFYGVGHATGFDMAAVGLALIPITIVVTIPVMLIEPNDHETFVQLINLKLTDVSSGVVVWSGSFFRDEKLQYSDVKPVEAVSDTLKGIVKEMVTQIAAVNFSPAPSEPLAGP